MGVKLENGLREGPGFIAFAGENGHARHTYTVMAPDPIVAPYHSLLLKRTPNARSPALDARWNTRVSASRPTGGKLLVRRQYPEAVARGRGAGVGFQFVDGRGVVDEVHLA